MAVLADRRDSVVSIPTVELLKMFACSVVWGLWMVAKNAVVRFVVDPLWFFGRRGGHPVARRSDSALPAHSATDVGDKAQDGLTTVRGHRDRPPPCLSNAIYGAHSYVKVKVTASFIIIIILYPPLSKNIFKILKSYH